MYKYATSKLSSLQREPWIPENGKGLFKPHRWDHLRAPTWEWPTLSRYSSESYRLSWETPSPHETSDGENHSELCYICIEVWI